MMQAERKWLRQHEEYLCSVLQKPNLSHYPDFSGDPLTRSAIYADQQSYCGDFLQGTYEAFLRRIEDVRVRWANRSKLPE